MTPEYGLFSKLWHKQFCMGFQPKSNLRDFDSIFSTKLDLSKLNSISKQHVSILNTVEVIGQTILHGIPAEKKKFRRGTSKVPKIISQYKVMLQFQKSGSRIHFSQS